VCPCGEERFPGGLPSGALASATVRTESEIVLRVGGFATAMMWVASCQGSRIAKGPHEGRDLLHASPPGPEYDAATMAPALAGIAPHSTTADIANGGPAAIDAPTDGGRGGDASLGHANAWCLQADGYNGFKGEPVAPGRFSFQVDDVARIEVSSTRGTWIPVSEPRAPHTVILYRYDRAVQKVRGLTLRAGEVLGFAYGGGIGTYVRAAPASAGCDP
jgi:hypothetical protein